MSMMLPPDPGAYPQGPPAPPAGPPPPPEAAGGGMEDRMRAVMDEVRAIAEEDGFTENERLTVEKITTLLQQLNAGREKEQNALTGGGPATQALARAYGQ